MSLQNRFTVYNASAGSGKTFQIALQYLNKIIQAQDRAYIYRLIGITFTNKAAEEMKKRIINSLIQAAQGNITGVMAAVSEASRAVIQKQTGITGDDEYRSEIIKRSKNRLFEILHYYDEFQLTTIDKLMYKIIRTFARDMQLSADVGVELEYREVVSNLIDKIINQVRPGSILSQFFIELSKDKIDDEKSWDIKQDLEKVSRIIFDDNYFDEIKSLENKSLTDFQNLRKILFAKRKALHKKLAEKHSEKVAHILRAFETDINHYYKKKIIDYLSHPEKFYRITWTEKQLENIHGEAVFFNKSYYKTHAGENDRRLQEFFMDHFHHRILYEIYSSMIANLNSLSFINELNREIENFKQENNLIFIHDFNKLILEQILAGLSADTPYIYMRLGEKYAHFFVDEFQDTSSLQWQNLIPLIKEALSKEFGHQGAGTAVIVGDAKQSIYRFRGGKPEQFIALSDAENQTPQANPFRQVTGKNVKNLEYNWRSQPQIVHFNNEFFGTFSAYLNHTYKSVYQRDKVRQKIPREKDRDTGFVQIRFLQKPEKGSEDNETYPEVVLENILQARQNGFRLDEICILVDTNRHGLKIAETLIAEGIDVVSSESLLVVSALKVKLLIGILRFIDTGKTIHLYDVVRYIALEKSMKPTDLFARFFAEQQADKKSYFQIFKDLGYPADYDRMMQLNLYDLLVYLIDVFKLTDSPMEYVYLQALMEKAHQFQIRSEANIRSFLQEWKNIEEKFSINAPEQDHAVRIMSVHKSKGLEFPVVIYYTQGELFSSRDSKNNTWVPVHPEEYNGFKYLPVEINKLKDSPDPVFREIYEKVKYEKIFDNLNRLYVALTRPSEQLYVVLPALPKSTAKTKFNQVFHDFLSGKDAQVSEHVHRFGNPKRTTDIPLAEAKDNKINKLSYRLWHAREEEVLKINTFSFERWHENKKNAIRYGLQLHEILSQVYTAVQWQQQREKLLADIPSADRDAVADIIEKLLKHPDLETYFSGEYRVLNEQSILIPAGDKTYTQKRPDRLLLKDREAVIIDYKTGKKHDYHRRQLDEYAGLLQEAGYKVSAKVLVYIRDKGIEVVSF